MTFIAKGAIFKNTREKLQKLMGDRFDETKKYPEVDGSFGIKDEDRLAFASYIMNAPLNDRNEIPVKHPRQTDRSIARQQRRQAGQHR